MLDDGTSVRPGSFRPTPGARVVDTRPSAKAIPAKGYRDVVVAGHGGVPAGASAAALNIVAVKPSAAGYLVAHSPSTARPGTTTLTYSVGVDRAGLSVVPLSSTGSVRLWNMSSAPVHVVVDAFGWVAAGDASATLAGLAVATPTRILDTRTASGGGALVAGSLRRVPLASSLGSGALLSVTVTGATRAGYLRFLAESDLGTLATPSFLNFAAGRTVTTSVLVPVPYRDTLHVSVEAVTTGSAHVVVDRIAVVGQRAEVTGTIRSEGSGAGVDGALVSTSATNRADAVSRAGGSYRAFPIDLRAVAICARTGSEQGAGLPAGRALPRGVRPQRGRRVEAAGAAPGWPAGRRGRRAHPQRPAHREGRRPQRCARRLRKRRRGAGRRFDSPDIVQFGTITGRTDGTWRAIVPPGTYVVSSPTGPAGHPRWDLSGERGRPGFAVHPPRKNPATSRPWWPRVPPRSRFHRRPR